MYIVRRELDAIDDLDAYIRSRPMTPDYLRSLVYLATGDAHQADKAQAELIKEQLRYQNAHNRRIPT